MLIRSRGSILLCVMLLAASRAQGQGAPGRAGTPAPASPRAGRGTPAAEGSVAGLVAGRPRVTPARVASAPSIDGRLDDEAWRSAARLTDFSQQRPLEGAAATERTEVLVAYDSRNLYFGIHAHYSDLSLMRANRADRDQTGRDDTVALYFDPFLDQQRAYVFSVNGYGVQGDAILAGGGGGQQGGQGGGGGGGGGGGRQGGGGRGGGGGGGNQGGGGNEDSSWDALFASAGRLVEDGWVAEVAIPFKSLRYPGRAAGQAHQWGFQVQRDVEGKNESDVWSPISRDVPGVLRQMGVLEGMPDLSASRNLELLPTFTAVRVAPRSSTTGLLSPDAQPDAGLNFKYGLTSNLTSDLTFNPDFSQIESDRQQIQVNQRFPLFFPELRPFFLEGQEIFQAQGPVTFVHTRTIVDPKYGAKLSGKIGRAAVGVLYANDQGPGNVPDRADPLYGQSANVLIGRVRYDLYSESSIGLLVTNRDFLESYSRVGGVDAQFRVGRNYRLNLRAMASQHRDLAGVERSGPMYDFGFRKEGRNLSYAIFHNQLAPGFRTDTGFVQRVDIKRTNTFVNYRFWPEGWIINWGPRAQVNRTYDWNGVLTDQEVGVSSEFQFAKNIFARAGVNRDLERFGGINFWKTRASFGASVNTSRRVSIGGTYNAGDQVRYLDQPFLGSGSNVSLFMTLRPFSRLQSQIDVTTSDLWDPRSNQRLFDVKIYRALTTYQFTPRLLVRNILDHNSFDGTLGYNLLMTYRVNSGTVFFAGYDDRFRQGDHFNATLYPASTYQRINRAVVVKLQYLFRY